MGESLKSPSPVELLEEVKGLLGAAIIQSLPSDDQIIMDRVRQAHSLVTVLWRAQRS